MKKLFFILIAFVLALLLGIESVKNPSYVFLLYRQWTVEIPTWLAVLFVILSFCVIHYVLLLNRGLMQFKKNTRKRIQQYSINKMQRLNQKGLQAFAERNWSSAEKFLQKSLKKATQPLIYYLILAETAYKQESFKRCEHYLSLAKQIFSESSLSIEIAQAQFLFKQNQLERFLSTLESLQQQWPNHKEVLQLLLKGYQATSNWQAIIDIIPALKRHKIIAKSLSLALQEKAYIELMRQALVTQDFKASDHLWRCVDKSLHLQPELGQLYVEQLIRQKRFKEAENIIQVTLKHTWSAGLVLLYEKIDFDTPLTALKVAQGWHKLYGEQPDLLYVLTQLALRNRLWAQVRAYGQAAMQLDISSEQLVNVKAILDKAMV